VFRDGCREDTVYVTSPKETKDVSTVNASLSPSSSHSSATSGSTSTEAKKIDDRAKDSDSKVKDLPPIRHGYIHEVRGPVNAYIIISKDEEERIREVFISVGKAGTTLNGMFQGLGRVMSVALRKHPDLIEEFIHTLRGIETGEFYSCNGISGKSLPDMIAKILDFYHSKNRNNRNTIINPDLKMPEVNKVVANPTPADNKEKISSDGTLDNYTQKGDLCPICGKLTLVKSGNCKTCQNCDYTTC
ncbi:MAG: hypothetical protein QXX12_02915, partial [Nanopusillaceae archaeon]